MSGVINSRNDLWDDILNVFGVETSARLFQKEDEEVVIIMLGMRCYRLSTKQNYQLKTIFESCCPTDT